MIQKWQMPVYYRHFKCKCENCRHTCCSNYTIPVTREEYYDLVTMECSPELNRRIQNAFVVPDITSNTVFRIIGFNYLGYCPIQKDGLCSICLEGHADKLPLVCDIYPRSLKKINNHHIACCSNSCEGVIELLSEEGSADLIEEETELETLVRQEMSEEDYGMMEWMRNIINENHSLNDNLINICKILNNDFENNYDSDEEPLDVLFKLMPLFKRSDSDLSEMIERVIDAYKNNYWLYREDEKLFKEKYPDYESFFKRIIFNNFLYVNFPFVDNRFNTSDAYKGLCLYYGMMKVICVEETTTEKNIVDCISAVFRLVEHTPFFYNVSFLKENVSILLKL